VRKLKLNLHINLQKDHKTFEIYVHTMTSRLTGLFTSCGFQDASEERVDWLKITWQRRNETTSNAADKRESNL
jgi:hypothetical protein